MLGSGCGGLLLHMGWSLLFSVWLIAALVVQLLASAILAIWAAIVYMAVSLLTVSNALKRPLYWEWHHLDTGVEELKFPAGFLWGVSTAAHQIEGDCDNNQWSRWENTKRPAGQPPTIKRGEKSGKACEHWERLDEDRQLAKDLGVGSFRFSIEWSKVEPREGEFDQAAIAHYHEEIDGLLAAGIVPMVTLLHFTHPLWLEDKGGFENASAPTAFVRFAERMYAEYGPKVSFWCTINEPEVCTANGYVIGMFPPGKLAKLQTSGIVLGNLLKAHVEAYTALHSAATAAGLEVKVGIVKDLFQFHPYKWYNVIDHLLAYLFDKLFNVVIIDFLKTGRYRYWVPFIASVRFTDERAPTANDFVGLNYYSHYYCSLWNLVFEPETEQKLRALPAETMTDMPHCIYPEGLYSALKVMCGIGHPVYVTENGIADADDTRRRLYLKRYLYALSRAIADGCDVRGYFYWSLYDNFEWCEGFKPRFGLYEVNFATQKRTLRDSSKYFVEVVKAHSGKYEPPLLPNPTGGNTRIGDGSSFSAASDAEAGFADLARKSGHFTRIPSKSSVVQDAQAAAGAGGAPHGGGGTGGGGRRGLGGGRSRSRVPRTYRTVLRFDFKDGSQPFLNLR